MMRQVAVMIFEVCTVQGFKRSRGSLMQHFASLLQYGAVGYFLR
jgi:hypothetical protein